jgi:C4-dicarboxylate-binding protein DctP
VKNKVPVILFSIVLTVLSAAQEGKSIRPESAALMRISLENTKDHIQVKVVQAFAKRLNNRLKGILEAQVFDSARLFRDRDVVTGLLQGKAEMAVPGIWNIEPSVPELGVLLLPEMYGRPAEEVHRLVDDDLGKDLSKKVETALGALTLGRWIDLGHAHIFTVKKQIRRYSDFNGLTIRVAGGIGNELRIRALGAEAISIAWPDFPARLMAGAVDGVLTTYETIASARLWDSGISYVFEDSQYFPMYIPLVNKAFFHRLPEWVRSALIEEWENSVDYARSAAAQAQIDAKTAILAKGIKVSSPSPSDVESARRLMSGQKDAMLRRMGIPSDFYALFVEALSRE